MSSDKFISICVSGPDGAAEDWGDPNFKWGRWPGDILLNYLWSQVNLHDNFFKIYIT
jgi:hypothetical protein